jgi:hypothetical protein
MLPFEASGLTLPTLHNSAEANEVAARFGVTPPGVRTRARWTQS